MPSGLQLPGNLWADRRHLSGLPEITAAHSEGVSYFKSPLVAPSASGPHSRAPACLHQGVKHTDGSHSTYSFPSALWTPCGSHLCVQLGACRAWHPVGAWEIASHQ